MSQTFKGMFLILSSAVLWSTLGTAAKFLPFSPFTINFFRSLFCLAFFLILRKGLLFTKINKIKVGMSICQFLALNLFLFANTLTTVGSAIVLQYTSPVYIILLTIFILKQKPRLYEILSVIIILFGMACFFAASLSGGQILGNVLAILSGVCLACVYFFARFPGADVLESFFLANIYNLFLLPLIFFDSGFTANYMVPHLWIIIILLAIFQHSCAWICFSAGMKYISALPAALISMIEPIISPLWAFIFLKEVLGINSFIGGAIVLFGLLGYNIISLRRAPFPNSPKLEPHSEPLYPTLNSMSNEKGEDDLKKE